MVKQLQKKPKKKSMARKPRKKVKKFKLGQAATMSGKLWNQWRNHILKTCPTWLWVAISLTHMLCARITEVLSLRNQDFHWATRRVTIRALKRQPEACNVLF